MLEKLRALNIGNQIIDREDSDPARRGLVQRLRELLDEIQRAEREIALWSNGRRPVAGGGPEPHLRLVPRPGLRRTNGTTATATSTRRRPRSSTSPKERQVWVAQQKIKARRGAAPTRGPTRSRAS